MLLKSLPDMRAVVHFRPKPISFQKLSRVISRPAASKRVENYLSRVGGNDDGTLRDHDFQLVYSGPHLVFHVTVRAGVLPEIAQTQAVRMEIFPLSPIVFDVFTAVAALLNWGP